jgi:hypothetical protein
MKWLTAFVYFVLAIIFMASKMLFVVKEGLIFENIIYGIDILFLIMIFGKSVWSFFKNKNEWPNIKINGYGIVFGLLILACWFFSFNYNVNKTIITGFDSIALYDARAKFQFMGISYRQMANIAPYDQLHKGYYLTYPPMVSDVHYYWEKYFPNIPVGVTENIEAIFLVLIIIVGVSGLLGINMALLIAFVTIANPLVFSVTLVEYSNLLFMVYFVGGVLAIIKFLDKKYFWELGFGIIFLQASMWIRYSEPLWFLVVLALIIVRKKYWKVLIPMFVAYLSWKTFVGGNGGWETGLKNLNFSLGIKVLITIIKSWSWFLGMMILTFFLNTKDKKLNIIFLFIKLVIIFSILMYVAGMYFLSLNYVWWEGVVKDSMLRSSVVLLPIVLIVYGLKLKESDENKEKFD